MKVPTRISASTQFNPGAHAYTEGDPRNGLGAVGQGLGQLGQSISRVGAMFQQRDEQTDRFNSLTGLSDFAISQAQAITDLKRGYASDGKGFAQTADGVFDKSADKFLSTVPPDLQGEFRSRLAQIKQTVMGDALRFQFESGDAHFKQGIKDEVSKSQLLLTQTPQLLEREKRRIGELIGATGLSQQDKEDAARAANIALESAGYKTVVKEEAGRFYNLGVGQSSDFPTIANAVIKKEEGYVGSAMWDVNHYRVGYSSDTVTLPDGTVREVQQGDVTSRADAERDLNRRIQAADTTGRQLAPQVWDTLGPGVKAGLASVYYHYGSYPDTVRAAIQTGDVAQIAGAVRELRSNPARRAREADLISGTQADRDPQFSSIPYEDKLALRADGEKAAQHEYSARMAAQQDQEDQARNDLYLGLLDGRLGAADIEAARQTGLLSKFEDVKKARDLWEHANETANLQAQALTKLATPGLAWDPSSDDDKKMLNALVGQKGLSLLQERNQDYFTRGVVPLVTKTGDVPTDVAGTLTGMFRSNDQLGASYALDAIAQLIDVNPNAANQRFTSDVIQAAELWDSQKRVAPDQAKLLQRVRGGQNMADIATRDALRKEAQAILGQTTNGIRAAEAMATKALGTRAGWFTSDKTTVPLAKQAMVKEFSTLFVEKYSMTENVDQAMDLAAKEMARNWGESDIGAGPTQLMKLPPAKVGYRPLDGSYDWIGEQAAKELGLPPGTPIQLLSDDQTHDEWDAWRRGTPRAPATTKELLEGLADSRVGAESLQGPHLPSYRIFWADAAGVYREAVNASGEPQRMWFEAPQEQRANEDATYDYRTERFRLEQRLGELLSIKTQADLEGLSIPPGDEQELADTRAALAKLDQAKPPTWRYEPSPGAYSPVSAGETGVVPLPMQ